MLWSCCGEDGDEMCQWLTLGVSTLKLPPLGSSLLVLAGLRPLVAAHHPVRTSVKHVQLKEVEGSWLTCVSQDQPNTQTTYRLAGMMTQTFWIVAAVSQTLRKVMAQRLGPILK